MKKILYILIVVLLIPFTVNAFEIDNLGIKGKDLKDVTFINRQETNDLYTFYVNNIYAYGETDRYKIYVRAVDNPIDHDYTPDKDLVDDVFGVLSRTNTNQYSYITNDQVNWIRVRYTTEDNINLLEYYLSYKDIFVTITAESKNGEFIDDDVNTLDQFIYSLHLTGKGKAEISHVDLNGIDTKPKKGISFLVIEVVICAASIGITLFVTKKGN